MEYETFSFTIFSNIKSGFLLYRALHLRFEKGMVGLSFCDFVGTREEKAQMAVYRKKEWPRRFKVLSNKTNLSFQLTICYITRFYSCVNVDSINKHMLRVVILFF